jgi:serine protease Do
MKRIRNANVLSLTLLVMLAGLLLSSDVFGQAKARPVEAASVLPSLADLVEKVKPGVVNISTTTTVRAPGNPFRHFFGQDEGPFSDFFRRYYGDVPDRELKQRSLGSGFLIDKEGYIITNNHVVERADEITVKVAGAQHKARIIGRDPKTDIALIKLITPVKDLHPLPTGDSDRVRVGDWAIAIGNPFGLEETVTLGIISATGRVIGAGPYDNFLQTDAPINPGNSGGPLLNLKGEVIGINTAIAAAGQGIGFAIPINTAKMITAQLRDKGKVTRGWIGIALQTITPEMASQLGIKETNGALVSDVAQGGPAEASGIERGDVIISFDSKELRNAGDLPRIVADTPIGKTVNVRLVRKGKQQDVTLKVAEMPSESLASPGRPQQQRTDLGMNVDNITQKHQQAFRFREKTGVVVVSVQGGGAADQAGIQSGDVIKEMNRSPVRNLSDYRTALRQESTAGSILLLIRRGENSFYVTIAKP